ncbi:thermonuclease family protein [Rhizobium sp. RU36D]|uniref:thermonuclease family protein n=1 Tax=Rhizobium sp. RU36D TaxID=1907415 RepID=UPI0011799F35|nr:thermonuclease family protein [Rhizobium sp. RU36D]
MRAISPELFSAPFAAGDGGLERIDPREALTPLEEKRAPWLRLARPQTIEAGVMAFGTRRLRLAGLTPTGEDKTCPTVDGGSWPCGRLARTHQRLFIRNRSVDCDLPGADWDGEAVARCEVAGIDMATWLAQSGWAEAEAGSSLEPLSAEARTLRRGLFGDDPRNGGPDTAADSPVASDGAP